MKFDEWRDSINASRYSSEYTLAKDAYNTAIDEAVKVCFDADKSTHPTDLGDKIKELKE